MNSKGTMKQAQGVWSLDLPVLRSPTRSAGWVLRLPLPKSAQLVLLSSTPGGGYGCGWKEGWGQAYALNLWGKDTDICEFIWKFPITLKGVQH